VTKFSDRNLGDLTPVATAVSSRPERKGASRNPLMNGREKSDKFVVPLKRANKSKSDAEHVEGRDLTKRNCTQTTTDRTQCRGAVSRGLCAVRQAARKGPNVVFTALLHHVTPEMLHASYLQLQRHSAAGIDGVTWQDYGDEVERKLQQLHDSLHAGRYRARPARRVYIPKADGSARPLSILCLEDKIVQQAVVTVLNAIYENDFVGFSYGFRPERGQHDALDAVHVGLYRRKVNWIVDADISKFFDTVDHAWLMKLLQHRIGDKRLLRLLQKWLTIGVWEDDKHTRSTQGVPQGAVISPLLANVYLHYVFDLWSQAWRKHRAQGDMIMIRYADDTIVGFEDRQEAEQFLSALHKRMAQFALSLHPDKTRLIAFGRFAMDKARRRGHKPATFDFLGFTHYCTQARSNGWFVVGRKTIKKRMRAQLQTIKQELRRRMHLDVATVGRWLHRVLLGHLNYYAVPGNGPNVDAFFREVGKLWLKMLRRRSQRHCTNWARFNRLRARYFPHVKIIHPHPIQRFDAKHSR